MVINKRIKICHLTSAHESTDVRIFEKECSSLAKNDNFEVYIVAKGVSRTENNVNVVGIGDCEGGRLKRMLNTAKTIYEKGLEIDADIYHLHDPELLRYAKRLKQRNKIVIFDSHENYSSQIMLKAYIPTFLRKYISKMYYSYETKIGKVIDAVIITEDLETGNYFQDRCKLCEFIDNTPKSEEMYSYFDDNRDYTGEAVCYVGSLAKTRGIMQLIKACGESGVKLILAGSFESDDFENEVRSMSEFKNIDYRGKCNRSEVRNIYSEAGIGANTLLNVGQYANQTNMSTKIYEYMAAGLPVISNSYPYIEKLVADYPFALLVDSSDYLSISEAINKLMNSEKLRKDMGKVGRMLSGRRFNWEYDENKLFSLYDKLLKHIGDGDK